MIRHRLSIIVLLLFLLSLLVVACDQNAPSSGSSQASTSTSNASATTTSSATPTTAITPTTALTLTPTYTPTSIAIAPPDSFTISLFGFSADGDVGQGKVDLHTVSKDNGVITLTNKSTTGSIVWSVSTPTESGGNWLGLTAANSDTLVSGGTLPPGQPLDYQIAIVILKNMQPGEYKGCIKFKPQNGQSCGDGNSVPVTLDVHPKVTGINPTNGPVSTSVTITGAGFTNATGVKFGSTDASFQFVNDTQITATSPTGSGTVDVTVTTANVTSNSGTADQFTYTSSAPTLTNISPNSGPAGTTVTITGTGFTGVTAVQFGSTTTTFQFVSDTQITTVSPAGSGTVDVTITTASGTSAPNAADQFTYI